MFRFALAAALFAALSAAQIIPERLLVLSGGPFGGVPHLWLVDPQTGSITLIQPQGIGGAWVLMPALALAVDPATGEAIVATRSGNSSLLTRVRFNGALMANDGGGGGVIPAIVESLTVLSNGDLLAAASGNNGGIYRMPLDGQPILLEWSAPNVSAISENGIAPNSYWVAEDFSPASPALTSFSATAAGVPISGGPLSILAGVRFTSVHDYANGYFTGAPERLVSDTQGTIYSISSLGPWGVVPPSQPIAAGGARRMKPGPTGEMIVLGVDNDPTLKSFPLGSTQVPTPVTMIANLGTSTVDFAWTGSATARAVTFGDACGLPAGPTAGTIAANGIPQLGNAGFSLGLTSGFANAVAVCAAGLNVSLPIPIGPSQCALMFQPTALLLQITNATGAATQPLPIPNNPALAGLNVYAQWWQFAPTPPATLLGSDSVALRIWP